MRPAVVDPLVGPFVDRDSQVAARCDRSSIDTGQRLVDRVCQGGVMVPIVGGRSGLSWRWLEGWSRQG